MSDNREGNLVFIFVTAVVLLNFPILHLVDDSERWLGFPALYFYLFFVWLMLIFAIGLIVSQKNKK